MTTYLITVDEQTESGDGPTVAYAYGDLDAMAYHVRRLKDAMKTGAVYVAELTEVASVPAVDSGRVVAAITGDAEIVSLVLGRRLRSERKATTPAASEEIVRSDA